jgi:hypothetical protein
MTTGRINQVARDEASTRPRTLLSEETSTRGRKLATPGIRHTAQAAAHRPIAGPEYRRPDRANSPEVQFRNQHTTTPKALQRAGTSTRHRRSIRKNALLHASPNKSPNCKLAAPRP